MQVLPEYQVAHERAVFKAIAVVSDTKKVVREMDIESLGELRAMQKPVVEVEDLLAAIIIARELKKNSSKSVVTLKNLTIKWSASE